MFVGAEDCGPPGTDPKFCPLPLTLSPRWSCSRLTVEVNMVSVAPRAEVSYHVTLVLI